MNRHMAGAMLVGLALAGSWACSPSRNRPGPPSVQIETPVGATVFSPDTLDFAVIAQDADGLDSIRVSVLDSTAAVDGKLETESVSVFSVPVPSGLLPGALITIVAVATDITGEQTVERATVTVIQRPPN